MNSATFEAEKATDSATESATLTLEALIDKTLLRNRQRNSSATIPKKTAQLLGKKRGLKVALVALDNRHYCEQCNSLWQGLCEQHNFRPVDDIPRRCNQFIER